MGVKPTFVNKKNFKLDKFVIHMYYGSKTRRDIPPLHTTHCFLPRYALFSRVGALFSAVPYRLLQKNKITGGIASNYTGPPSGPCAPPREAHFFLGENALTCPAKTVITRNPQAKHTDTTGTPARPCIAFAMPLNLRDARRVQ